jgi:hypothetical protein
MKLDISDKLIEKIDALRLQINKDFEGAKQSAPYSSLDKFVCKLLELGWAEVKIAVYKAKMGLKY